MPTSIDSMMSFMDNIILLEKDDNNKYIRYKQQIDGILGQDGAFDIILANYILILK